VKDSPRAEQYGLVVDLGEAEAIELAREVNADWLLIDERKGRKLAREAGLPVIGLLGVVLLARRNSLIPSAREGTGKRTVGVNPARSTQTPKRETRQTAWLAPPFLGGYLGADAQGDG
jgi:hypothetical protein